MADNEFHFTVKEGTKTVATGGNASAADEKSGAITFSTIEYDQTNVGTHTYYVTEDTVTQSGVAVNKQTFRIVVKVYLDDNDDLKAVIVGKDSVDIDFINTYASDGSITFRYQS